MKTMTKLLKAPTLFIVAFGVLLAVTHTGPARADRGEGRRRQINALPPVGITLGQTLHVTFLNTGDNPFEIIPCVFEADGEDVKEGTSITLAPGQMRSFEVRWSELGARVERRVQLRAVAHVNAQDLKHLVVTGEVIDEETGKSSLFVPGSRVGFDPQADPPSPN